MTPNDLLGLSDPAPGVFRRTSTGAPLVAHPTDLLKDGSRPKTIMYGRPSSFGKQVENTYNLMKWAERRVALGLAADGDLYDEAAALLTLELDSAEFREQADKIAANAKRAALAFESAERGTHAHALTEDDDEERDTVKRIEDGAELGIPADAQRAMLAAWRRMLHEFGLEILAVEAACVHDDWRKAGTLDRIARLTKELSFDHQGETIILPQGTVVVLDVKTGKLTRGADGLPNYWNSYAVQIATYAGSVPYDTVSETRSEWAWPIDQRWALIAHLPVLDAMAGQAVCRLVPVDIEAGRQAAELCMAGAAWERNRAVFGVIAQEIVVDSLEPKRVAIQKRIDDAKAAGLARPLVAMFERLELPTLKQADTHTLDDLARIAAALDTIERDHHLGFPEAPAEPEVLADTTVAAKPEPTYTPAPPHEGDTLDDATYAAIQATYEATSPDARLWIGARASEAHRAGVPFHLKGNATTRRFEVLRCCLVGWDLGDEIVREAVAVVVDATYPTQQTITLGAVLGSLTVDEAARLARLLDEINNETVGVQLALDGTLSLTGDLTAYSAAA